MVPFTPLSVRKKHRETSFGGILVNSKINEKQINLKLGMCRLQER